MHYTANSKLIFIIILETGENYLKFYFADTYMSLYNASWYEHITSPESLEISMWIFSINVWGWTQTITINLELLEKLHRRKYQILTEHALELGY